MISENASGAQKETTVQASRKVLTDRWLVFSTMLTNVMICKELATSCGDEEGALYASNRFHLLLSSRHLLSSYADAFTDEQ